MQFFNEGSTLVMALANTLYFASYDLHIEPFWATIYMCIIMLPEACAFFFGMLSESVSIFGSRRRGHLLVASFLQTLCSALILIFIANDSGDYTDVGLSIFLSMSVVAARTWMTPVVEALMVAEQKKDLPHGSEDLYTFG
jgi:FlaA1/EpsC-like NDP-sugar epimerase